MINRGAHIRGDRSGRRRLRAGVQNSAAAINSRHWLLQQVPLKERRTPVPVQDENGLAIAAYRKERKDVANVFTITKILLPIDFSERSAKAAAAVAERFHSEITLLHILAPRFEAPLAIPGQRTVVHGFAREEAEARMQEFQCQEWHRLQVKRVPREGDPARAIVEYAESEHIDLIMMPTHGYGPFRRLLLGSVTAKVLHEDRKSTRLNSS